MDLEIMYTVFLKKMVFLEIKKFSDALLRSDARADQNQVIFFYLALDKVFKKLVMCCSQVMRARTRTK